VAHELTDVLSRERVEMGAIAQTLDLQAAKVVDTIGQQARMFSEASDLAETQLREAEAALSARAADLAAAAYRDGQLAGVLTAQVMRVKQVRSELAMIRVAVDPAHRRAHVARALTLFSRDLLHRWAAANPAAKLAGLGAIVEGQEMTEHGKRSYWPETRFILAGYLPDGRQLRISWFEDFRVDGV
jgi:GNAT superfamily N-acetyltransferase